MATGGHLLPASLFGQPSSLPCQWTGAEATERRGPRSARAPVVREGLGDDALQMGSSGRAASCRPGQRELAHSFPLGHAAAGSPQLQVSTSLGRTCQVRLTRIEVPWPVQGDLGERGHLVLSLGLARLLGLQVWWEDEQWLG